MLQLRGSELPPIELHLFEYPRNADKSAATHHTYEGFKYFCIPPASDEGLREFVIRRFLEGRPCGICEHLDRVKPHRFFVDLDVKKEPEADAEKVVRYLQSAIVDIFRDRRLAELPRWYRGFGISPQEPDPYTVVMLVAKASGDVRGNSYHLVWPFLLVSPRAFADAFQKLKQHRAIAQFPSQWFDKPAGNSLRAPFCDKWSREQLPEGRPFVFEAVFDSRGRRMRNFGDVDPAWPLPSEEDRREDIHMWMVAVWALTSLRVTYSADIPATEVIHAAAEDAARVQSAVEESSEMSATAWSRDQTVYSAKELDSRLKLLGPDASASVISGAVVEYLNRCLALYRSRNSIFLVKAVNDEDRSCPILLPMTENAASVTMGVPVITLPSEESESPPECGGAEGEGRQPPRNRRRVSKKKKGAKTTPFKVWLNDINRREVRAQVFSARPVPLDVVNLFHGWSFKEEELELAKGFTTASGFGLSNFLEHIFNVHACQEVGSFHYLMDWFAFILCHPDIPTVTCPVLVGKEGVGKTLLGRAVASYMGTAAVKVNGVDSVVGRFNSSIMGKLFVHVDEVHHLTTDETSKLKALISEREKQIEYKGVDIMHVTCPSNFLITSNNTTTQIMTVGSNARRFAFLSCPKYDVLTEEYWKRVYEWLDFSGQQRGCKSLIHFIRSRFPRVMDKEITFVPNTGMLCSQKLCSMPTEHVFFHECVQQGFIRTTFSNGDLLNHDSQAKAEWTPDGLDMQLNALHGYFVLWCDHNKRRQNNVVMFSLLLSNLLGEHYVITQDRRETWMVHLPAIGVCKAQFLSFYGLPMGDGYMQDACTGLRWRPLPRELLFP